MAEVMKKEVDSIEEASLFVSPLMAENKWAITVAQRNDGKFIIQWTEHRMYTAQDGVEYRDEVWTTKEGNMVLIQDLEPEHAKNIIRMMLRQEREAKQAMDALYQRLSESLNDGLDSYTDNDSDQSPPTTLLH